MRPRQKHIKFVEAKDPYLPLVGTLLEACAAQNQWANFGPLYSRLVDAYAEHMKLPSQQSLTACANAGVGLELLARGLAAESGLEKLRWVGSAFSFKNLGRGYFSDMQFLDCDTQGVLDLASLKAKPLEAYDGFIVTNPFGLYDDFERFIQFAQQTGKKLIIDNAAGIGRVIPAWSWQVFSLHHTKPYGVGEGGIVVAPTDVRDFLHLIINYDEIPGRPEYWLNNGKISDISCAFLLARLSRIDDWESGYFEQQQRARALFSNFDISLLLDNPSLKVANSIPVLMGQDVDDGLLASLGNRVDVARQYVPLASFPMVDNIARQIINFPTHPDLGKLSDSELCQDIEGLISCCRAGLR